MFARGGGYAAAKSDALKLDPGAKCERKFHDVVGGHYYELALSNGQIIRNKSSREVWLSALAILENTVEKT